MTVQSSSSPNGNTSPNTRVGTPARRGGAAGSHSRGPSLEQPFTPVPKNQNERADHNIPPPTPLLVKPKLDQLKYGNTCMPSIAPAITQESSSIDYTANKLAAVLESKQFDSALWFLIRHQKLVRLFEPRVVLVNKVWVTADHQLDTQQRARAMIWYLCDPGLPGSACTTCTHEGAQSPFEKCVVPRDPDAKGSCTNCWWSKGSHRCSRRVVETPSKKTSARFEGFQRQDLREATDHNLDRWHGRIMVELSRREEERTIKTPRGRQRYMDEEDEEVAFDNGMQLD